jgi:WD40 repeat protein
LWDLTTGKLSKSLGGHVASVSAVCLTKLGNQGLAVSGSHDSSLKLWDLDSGKLVRSIHAHDSGVLCVAAQGGIIASGGGDNNVKLWFVRNGKLAKTLSGHTAAVVAVTLGASVAAEIVVSGSSDKTAKVRFLPKRTKETMRTARNPRNTSDLHLPLCSGVVA